MEHSCDHALEALYLGAWGQYARQFSSFGKYRMRSRHADRSGRQACTTGSFAVRLFLDTLSVRSRTYAYSLRTTPSEHEVYPLHHLLPKLSRCRNTRSAYGMRRETTFSFSSRPHQSQRIPYPSQQCLPNPTLIQHSSDCTLRLTVEGHTYREHTYITRQWTPLSFEQLYNQPL